MARLPPRRLVVVGLGNYPYPLTRHSIGQILVKNLAIKASTQLGATGSSALSYDNSLQIWKTQINLRPLPRLATTVQGISRRSLEILFMKPKTLMNISGPPIYKSMHQFLSARMSDEDGFFRVVTLQDDLDVSPGQIKYQKAGSARGHNGIRSLERSLSSRNFHRLRIGIGRPDDRNDVAKFVLSALGRDEVRACECNEDGKGGAVLEAAWKEILGIGWEGADEE